MGNGDKLAADVVTMNEIIGANVVALRERTSPKMSQDVLTDELRARLPRFSRIGVVELEKGRRDIKVDTLFALADIFDVPVWSLFVPQPETADAWVLLPGGRQRAYEFLVGLLDPETRRSPEFYAYSLITAIVDSGRNDSEAVDAMRSAVRRTRAG